MDNNTTVTKKIKHRITISASNFTSGYMRERTESRDSNRYLYTNIHSIIHNSQKIKTTQYPSTDKYINKMWYTHTIEYYLTINGILLDAV